MLCPTLRKVEMNHVRFDPTNVEHLEAFQLLCLGDRDQRGVMRSKQHPVLRFVLEDGYPDVRSMMLHKVGQHYINTRKRRK